MMKRLLITGAAGGLGQCAATFDPFGRNNCRFRSGWIGEAAAHEEIIYCDLGDKAAVEAMVEGCDGIVHLGGQPIEHTWEVVKNANIDGIFNLYEAARKSSVTPRILLPVQITPSGFMNKQCA